MRPPDPNPPPVHGNQMAAFVAASLRANFLSGAVLSFAFVVGGSWNSGLMRGEEQMERHLFSILSSLLSSYFLFSFFLEPGECLQKPGGGGVGVHGWGHPTTNVRCSATQKISVNQLGEGRR